MIQNLQDKKQVLANKAINIEQIIDQYSQVRRNSRVLVEDLASTDVKASESSILDKITSLLEDRNDQKYNQSLLNQRLQLLQDMEALQGDITKFKRAQERLLNSQQEVSEDNRAAVIDDIKSARQNFESLLSEYQHLLEARNQRVLGKTSSLYSLASDKVIVESSLISRLKIVIVYTALSGFIVLAVAVMIALFRRPRPVEKA